MEEIFDELDGIKKGDWVRFYSDSKLVIGVVQYLFKDKNYQKCAATDIGSVFVNAIFESRMMYNAELTGRGTKDFK